MRRWTCRAQRLLPGILELAAFSVSRLYSAICPGCLHRSQRRFDARERRRRVLAAVRSKRLSIRARRVSTVAVGLACFGWPHEPCFLIDCPVSNTAVNAESRREISCEHWRW